MRLVAAFWLRSGNCSCANKVVSFFLDLWDNLPAHLRLRVVRSDSGFYVSELLRFCEQLRVKFIVVARPTRPVQSVLRRETRGLATGLEGAAVADLGAVFKRPRRSAHEASFFLKTAPSPKGEHIRSNAMPFNGEGSVVSITFSWAWSGKCLLTI